MDYTIVKGEDGLRRDSKNGAIVVMPGELESYRIKKALGLRERDKERKFNSLENEVKDIKNILLELMSKLDKIDI